VKEKHQITYDSDKEDAFLVHMDNKIIEFECSPDGLYQYSVSSRYQQGLKEDLISTVAENRQGYTLRQFERAKEARKLYHIVGAPTMNNFNFQLLLRMNVIQKCLMTVEDINIS
jgi:hypothetical protein